MQDFHLKFSKEQRTKMKEFATNHGIAFNALLRIALRRAFSTIQDSSESLQQKTSPGSTSSVFKVPNNMVTSLSQMSDRYSTKKAIASLMRWSVLELLENEERVELEMKPPQENPRQKMERSFPFILHKEYRKVVPGIRNYRCRIDGESGDLCRVQFSAGGFRMVGRHMLRLAYTG